MILIVKSKGKADVTLSLKAVDCGGNQVQVTTDEDAVYCLLLENGDWTFDFLDDAVVTWELRP